ncbi:uncharacterized protein O3C94_018295 [Discoglossus pictus]
MGHTVFLILYIFLYFDASQAKLELITDPSPVSVKAGETVHLKCILKVSKLPVDLSDLMVQWYTRGKQMAEYDTKLVIDKPGLSMSIDALKKGDATLTISNVTHENSGNYRCYFFYNSDHSRKETVLFVDDPNKPKEEDLPLNIAHKVLTEKLDKISEGFNKLDMKVDELIREAKKCTPK